MHAFDRYDNELTGLAVQWASADAGSISETGSFQASTRADEFEEGIIARVSSRGVARTARVVVTVNPDPLDHIVLAPPVLDLHPRGQQQLTVAAFD